MPCIQQALLANVIAVRKKRKLYNARHHDGSFWTQKQPEIVVVVIDNVVLNDKPVWRKELCPAHT